MGEMMYDFIDRTDGNMNWCVDGWIDEWIDGWMGVGINGWMVGFSETIPAWARLD
jgi:hypothetical protein